MSSESAIGWPTRRDQMNGGVKVLRNGEWTTIKGKRRTRRHDEEHDEEEPMQETSHVPSLASSHPPLLPTPTFGALPFPEKRVKQGKQGSVVCRYYLQGFCRDGKRCHFVHALFPQPLKRSQTQPSSSTSKTPYHHRSASDLQSETDQSEDEAPAQDPHVAERGTPPSYNSDSPEEKITTFSSGRSTSSDSGSETSVGLNENPSLPLPSTASPRLRVSPSIPIPLHPPGLVSHSSPLFSSFSPESLGGLSGFSSSYSHVPSEISPSKINRDLDSTISSSRSYSLSGTPGASWAISPRSSAAQRDSPVLSVSAPGSFGSPSFLSLPPPKFLGSTTQRTRWSLSDKDNFSLNTEESSSSSSSSSSTVAIKFEELEDDAIHADLDLKLVELAVCDGPESELLDQHPSIETTTVPQDSEQIEEPEPPFVGKESSEIPIPIPIEINNSRSSRSYSLRASTPEAPFSSHILSTSAPLSFSAGLLPPPLSPKRNPNSKKELLKQKSKSPRLDSAKSRKVCVFFLQGICRYGTACQNRHQHVVSDVCLSCGNNVGITLKEQKQHLKLCSELTMLNKEKKLSATKKCCLCAQYTVKVGRKFGLLISCNHPFCLQCIREYRGSSDRPSVRACPKCKVTSHYVIPCDRYVSETGRKDKVISEYKRRLGQIDCKHFNKGKATCPFGDACFYRHSTGETKTTRVPLKKSQSHPPSLSTTPLSSPLLHSYPRTQPKPHKFQPSAYSPIPKDRRPLLPLKKFDEESNREENEISKMKKNEGIMKKDKNGKTNSKFVKSTKSQSFSASSTPVFHSASVPPGIRKELSMRKGKKSSEMGGKPMKKKM